MNERFYNNNNERTHHERPQSIQDTFLNNLRRSKTPVTIFLANGVKLQGVIAGFDNFSFLLRRGPQTQLVYKHTVATVVPSAPMPSHHEHGESHGQHVPSHYSEDAEEE